ncbi:MAG: helix-turn-helix transcriptional regulator [Pseudomonadota bacterium]
MSELHDRLRTARAAAGFRSATAAAERFGWATATYTQHENGTRGIKADRAADYARAFNVEEQWLLFGKGSGPKEFREIPASRPTRATGFSEPDVVPFTPPPGDGNDAITAAADAATARGDALYRITVNYPDLFLLAGDVIVTSLRPTGLREGLVVVTYADGQTGSAVTRIRRSLRGMIVHPFGEKTDPGTPAIMGAVTGVLRTFDDASAD